MVKKINSRLFAAVLAFVLVSAIVVSFVPFGTASAEEAEAQDEAAVADVSAEEAAVSEQMLDEFYGDASVPDFYEMVASNQFSEIIGEPMDLKADGSMLQVTDDVAISVSDWYADDFYGSSILEMILVNNGLDSVYAYATRLAVDGVDMAHNMAASVQPHYKSFMRLETLTPFLEIFEDENPHVLTFKLLMFKGNDETPIYNNTITCVLNEDEVASFTLGEDGVIKTDEAEIKVFGLTRMEAISESHVFLLAAVHNTTDETKSFLLHDVSFDGCVGISTLGTWCEPGGYSELIAEVSPAVFADMVEDENNVEVSMLLTSFTSGEDGDMIETEASSGQDYIDLTTGMMKG